MSVHNITGNKRVSRNLFASRLKKSVYLIFIRFMHPKSVIYLKLWRFASANRTIMETEEKKSIKSYTSSSFWFITIVKNKKWPSFLGWWWQYYWIVKDFCFAHKRNGIDIGFTTTITRWKIIFIWYILKKRHVATMIFNNINNKKSENKI